MSAATTIQSIFESAGATAKISSIHVNGWFGDYDKLAMTDVLFREVFRVTIDEAREQAVFCGDSPNDSPMFAYFGNSVGVANIHAFVNELTVRPTWVTRAEGGYGFAEMVKVLLDR